MVKRRYVYKFNPDFHIHKNEEYIASYGLTEDEAYDEACRTAYDNWIPNPYVVRIEEYNPDKDEWIEVEE